MKRRWDRTHAVALLGVLVLHGGLVYALWSVRLPAHPEEAKVLFVNLVEPTAGTPSPSAKPAPSATPSGAARSTRKPERKSGPASGPSKTAAPEPAPVQAPEPAVDAAPLQRPAIDTPATSPGDASPSAAPTDPARASSTAPGGTDKKDGAGHASLGAGASDGPVALASELALVCSERRAPPYPSVSRRLGEAGRVVLRVELDATGRVIRAKVVESSGFERLDSAALAAVRTWRCAPPRRDGQAVGAVALQPFDFTLNGP